MYSMSPHPSAARKHWITIVAFVSVLTVLLLLLHPTNSFRLHGWVHSAEQTPPEQPPTLPPAPPEIPGFYNWTTKSSFSPVRLEDVANKSVQELCAAWPTHLLDEVQPILKTGHGVLESRLGPHLDSVSACLVNLLIFSDTEEYFRTHQLIDVIADIPTHLRDSEKHIAAWRDGSIARGEAERKEAWRLDRFKFFPSISRAWRMRPNRKWYVFFEGDTFVVWDNVFRMLDNFDADEPLYFGFPSPGAYKTWFANGGPGYILSRAAMKRLIKDDYDSETGAYIGSKLVEKYWDVLEKDCCGDSSLGWALILNNITLSGMWPLFTPGAPHALPYAGERKHWCSPVLTMHRPLEADMLGLWSWQWEHRQMDRPLLYRDMAIGYYKFAELTTRYDWNNVAWDSDLASIPEDFSHEPNPHQSPEACATACENHPNCFSWTLHLRQCYLTRSLRYGKRT